METVRRHTAVEKPLISHHHQLLLVCKTKVIGGDDISKSPPITSGLQSAAELGTDWRSELAKGGTLGLTWPSCFSWLPGRNQHKVPEDSQDWTKVTLLPESTWKRITRQCSGLFPWFHPSMDIIQTKVVCIPSPPYTHPCFGKSIPNPVQKPKENLKSWKGLTIQKLPSSHFWRIASVS